MLSSAAANAPTTREHDFVMPYVNDLKNVIDMDAIRSAGLKLGVDPLGGASQPYWEPINSVYGLDVAVVNNAIDPTFSFMTLDHDGKIRMDCSSPYAMASLVKLKDQYQVAFGNDTDSDRHGIVTPSAGLLNPNHYLAVAIQYLLTHRDQWMSHVVVGKTLVSSSMIDRVVNKLGRKLSEVPVGFKWFAPGLVRRHLLLRRRRERRSQLSAPRWHRLDHRQRRHHHGPAGGGDYGDNRKRSRANTSASWWRNSGCRTTRASTRLQPRSRKRNSASSLRSR